VKVTVIATGFPEPAGSHSARTVVSAPIEREEESVRGRIFNSLTTPKAKEETSTPAPVAAAPEPKAEPRPVAAEAAEDDEDWGAVPAFLRRSKLK